MQAYLTQGNKALVIATTSPTVETITYSNSDAWPRICTRELTLMPVPPVKETGK